MGHLLLRPSQIQRLMGFQRMGPQCEEHICYRSFYRLEREAGILYEPDKSDGRLGEVFFAPGVLNHGDLYKLSIHWDGGSGERIPSYANRVVQDDKTKIFNAQVWQPENNFVWNCENFIPASPSPVIYEAHIGMASSEEKIGTYREFYRKRFCLL